MEPRSDDYEAIMEEVYGTTHPICPKCGFYMEDCEESYGLNGIYTDKWYECPICGYCLDR